MSTSRVALFIVAGALGVFGSDMLAIRAENPPAHVHRVMKTLPQEWRYVAATLTYHAAAVASVHLGRTTRLAGGVVSTWRRFDYEPPQGPAGATRAAKIVARVEYRCEPILAFQEGQNGVSP